ncbi:hypothetical protein AVEN_139738-1, partial [Araneus ventricosus]
GVGEIAEVGEDVDNFKVGQSVTYMNSNMNTFAEYVCVPAAEVFPIPEANPGYLTLLVSGLTAGNQSIDQYLFVHKDPFSNPPTNRRLVEAVVVDWSKIMKFKAS